MVALAEWYPGGPWSADQRLPARRADRNLRFACALRHVYSLIVIRFGADPAVPTQASAELPPPVAKMPGQRFNVPCSSIIRSALPRVVVKIHMILTDSMRVLPRPEVRFPPTRRDIKTGYLLLTRYPHVRIGATQIADIT